MSIFLFSESAKDKLVVYTHEGVNHFAPLISLYRYAMMSHLLESRSHSELQTLELLHSKRKVLSKLYRINLSLLGVLIKSV